MKLEEHLHILRELRIPYKGALTKILWTIFTEHKDEIKDIDKDVVAKIYPPRTRNSPIMKVCNACGLVYPETDPQCPRCQNKDADKVVMEP